jgi:general secretion pathway protein G
MNRNRLSARAARAAQRGMTLLEIMIVVAILGLLATVVVSNLMGKFDNAKVQTTKLKINEVKQTIEQYYTLVGEYPDSLDSLVSPPEGYSPLIKAIPKDAWNKPLVFKRGSSDDSFEVFSVGKDGQAGTKDDVK